MVVVILWKIQAQSIAVYGEKASCNVVRSQSWVTSWQIWLTELKVLSISAITNSESLTEKPFLNFINNLKASNSFLSGLKSFIPTLAINFQSPLQLEAFIPSPKKASSKAFTDFPVQNLKEKHFLYRCCRITNSVPFAIPVNQDVERKQLPKYPNWVSLCSTVISLFGPHKAFKVQLNLREKSKIFKKRKYLSACLM